MTQRLNAIFSLFFILFTVACTKENEGLLLQGKAQGTTYTVIVSDLNIDVKQSNIDSIFTSFDRYLSLYRKDSYLSKLNASESYQFEDSFGYFSQCYFLTELLFEQTNGLLDPTLYPILNAWKLYTAEGMAQPFDQNKVNELMQYVGFNKEENYQIKFKENEVRINKRSEEIKFDFNAIAQGFSADVVAEYLEDLGAQNFYVEIGGEIVVKGKNPEGKKWRIGIDKPENTSASDRELALSVTVVNGGVATSGSYRNFVEKEGKKYSHIFNPKTGSPVISDVLSVTVFAPSAGLADGYATYFMLIGRKEIKQFCKENPDVSAIVMYHDGKQIKTEVAGTPSFIINR